MTNFDALKAIYEALGGEEEISGTNLDALKAIAEVAGGGGGGGGAIFCTFSGSPRVGDKTWGELYEAIQSGKTVYFVVTEGINVYYDIVTNFTATAEEPPAYSAMSQSVSWLLSGTADEYPTEDMG